MEAGRCPPSCRPATRIDFAKTMPASEITADLGRAAADVGNMLPTARSRAGRADGGRQGSSEVDLARPREGRGHARRVIDSVMHDGTPMMIAPASRACDGCATFMMSSAHRLRWTSNSADDAVLNGSKATNVDRPFRPQNILGLLAHGEKLLVRCRPVDGDGTRLVRDDALPGPRQAC